MPVSVIGSVAGGGPTKQRRISASQAAKSDSSFAAGLQTLAVQRRQQDQDFVFDFLRESEDETIVALSTMIKAGTLSRSLCLAGQLADADEAKGEVLSPQVKTMKALLGRHQDELLQALEPDSFTNDVLLQLSRAEKKELLAFAFNCRETTPLPTHQERLSRFRLRLKREIRNHVCWLAYLFRVSISRGASYCWASVF
jgi:hypothetical protein